MRAIGVSELGPEIARFIVQMSASVEDVFMLLGDSITQSGWQPYGFGQRLACKHFNGLPESNIF